MTSMPSLNNSPTAVSLPRQNQLGLSYAGLIVVALRNSETRIASDFFPRALTISDIYDFLRVHVRSFQQMEKKEWEKTSRVLRHSLSQATYFQRFQVDEAGNGKIVASKQLGAGKGALWTLFPAKGESEEDAEIRIQKLFKGQRCEVFGKNLVNERILKELISGDHGWKDAYLQPLKKAEVLKQKKEIEKKEKPAKATKSSKKPKALLL